MKPKNFPERKRQRQLRALQRLLVSGRDDFSVTKERQVLEERTVTNLHDVRTKKRRAN